MDTERGALWRALIDAWNDDTPACHLHYARQYVSAYPHDPVGWMALADVLASFALYDEARTALQTSSRLCPRAKRYHVHEQMGHLYKSKCRLRVAEKWYRRAVAEHPRQENLVFLGACLAKQGDFQEAMAVFRRAVKECPETADEAYFNLGLISRAEGKHKQALAYFKRAIAIDPDYRPARDAQCDVEVLIDILSREGKGRH